jgi:hypothetical protein
MAEFDAEREDRIAQEILVDTYNEEEIALGWYYYLEDHLNFPFAAEWDHEAVQVISISNEEICKKDIFVEVEVEESGSKDEFPVPLRNLTPLKADEATEEAIADWNYWLNQGNSFDFSEEYDEY